MGFHARIYSITKLSNAISLSNINPLPLYSLFEQTIHIVTHAHHIDGTAKEFFQFILHEVEREERWGLTLIADIDITICGLLTTCYGSEYANACQIGRAHV